MTEKEKTIKEIKTKIKELANLTLNLDVMWTINELQYNENDLVDSSLIFIHILWNIWISHLLSCKLDEEQIKILSEEFGENIRQSVLLYTWLDTHILANNYKDNERL